MHDLSKDAQLLADLVKLQAPGHEKALERLYVMAIAEQCSGDGHESPVQQLISELIREGVYLLPYVLLTKQNCRGTIPIVL